MGRKKISIKPILSAQGRKITYNKRKVGLLKKVVEISAMCGVSVNLEFEDTDGNIIKIQAPDPNLEKKRPPITENTFHITPKDYPTFEILPQVERKPRRVIKKRSRISTEEPLTFSKEKIEQGVPSKLQQNEKAVLPVKSESSTGNYPTHPRAFQSKPQDLWVSMQPQVQFAPVFQHQPPQTHWIVAPIYQFQPSVFPAAVLW